MKELRFIQPAPSQDLEGAAKGRRRVAYELATALTEDKDWLESLRRDVYQELFKATFGGWDEVRLVRQFAERWERGSISIITVGGLRVGMIQLFQDRDAMEVGEIQIQPSYQSRGIGSRILRHHCSSS